MWTPISSAGIPAFLKFSQRTTIYVSDYDEALKCSEDMHSNHRVGEGGDTIFVADGVDTIDASQIERPAWYAITSYLPCVGGGHL